MRKPPLPGVVVAALCAAAPAMAHYVRILVGGTTGVLHRGDYPGASLNISADLGVGNVVGDDIPIRPLPGDDRHGYFCAHGRVYIVDLDTRVVVDIRGG